MKPWLLCVAGTVLFWGMYIPTLHHGQSALPGRPSALRAFLFVGLAYFVVSIGVLAYVVSQRPEPFEFTTKGVGVSTLAGVFGAVGALGIVFAIRFGGNPIYVAPLVFGCAPIVNTIISMAWDKPAKSPAWPFYAGIVLAGLGAALVLRFKPT